VNQQARPLIVVGVDGSRSSRIALRWAVEEAAAVGGRVRAVMCWTWTWSPLNSGAPQRPSGKTELLTPEEATELRLLDAVSETLGDEPSVPVRCKAVQGDAPRALAEAAEGAQLLVVGTRGYSGVNRVLFGSVSQNDVRHARCNVVVVRDADARTPRRPAILRRDRDVAPGEAPGWRVQGCG
jgi:nucleotide-binding universal stress UspA family protein